MPASHVSAMKFVEVWQTSSSLREVSRKLGIRRPVLKNRARRYRQVGVPLKELDTEPMEYLDWAEVGKFAQSYLEKKPAEPPSTP